jgi:hypothetical protein
MADTGPDLVAAYLAGVRERSDRPIGPSAGALPISNDAVRGLMESAADVPRLAAALEAVLFEHRIDPLYAHADRGECGCPHPNADFSAAFDDAVYDSDHPDGYGPDGNGLVCLKKVVGHWCRGCADVAVEHGCFEVPKAYPPEKCPVRGTITRELLGSEAPGE